MTATKKSREIMDKIHYRRVVYSCGFVKSMVTSILGFAILLIFQNVLETLDVPLTSTTQIIFGLLITIACVSIVLLFDSNKEKTKEAELDLIFEEVTKLYDEKQSEMNKDDK